MTQGLRNLLNLPLMEDMLRNAGVLPETASLGSDQPKLPPADQSPKPGQPPGPDRTFAPDEPLDPVLARTVAWAEQAKARLEMIDGRDHAEAMDALHKETRKHAQDLMDLGFNIDIPRARGIFEVAANLYGRSIEAKNAKRDGELKAMRLALEQRKLDLAEQRLNAEHGTIEPAAFQADTSVIKEDRNALIKRLRAQREPDQS
jgi:hypothetical protein